MYEELFKKNESKTLRGYAVWVPVLGGKRKDAKEATRLVPDSRVAQSFDPGRVTMKLFQDSLDLSEPAWDIYMIYEPGIRWTAKVPPAPSYWMHQLGSAEHSRVDGPYLDAKKFAQRAVKTL